MISGCKTERPKRERYDIPGHFPERLRNCLNFSNHNLFCNPLTARAESQRKPEAEREGASETPEAAESVNAMTRPVLAALDKDRIEQIRACDKQGHCSGSLKGSTA